MTFELKGTANRDNFVLGRAGLVYSSLHDPSHEHPSWILGLTPQQDAISLPGTIRDYLLRPTSLPYAVGGYAKGSPALGIYFTNRNERVARESAWGRQYGNEISLIAYLVQPKDLLFDPWIQSLGLRLDSEVNATIDAYNLSYQQIHSGTFAASNYYTEALRQLFLFDGSGAPQRSSLAGEVTQLSSEAKQGVVYFPSESLNNFSVPLSTWNTLRFGRGTNAQAITRQWFGTNSGSSLQTNDLNDLKYLEITASSWSGTIQINRVAQASNGGGETVWGLQTTDGADPRVGSVVNGGSSNDIIRGLKGWDILDGGVGNDLIKAGNGRDIITGGAGSDELHGDFGWNTFSDERDNASDLIVIKSDEYLVNHIYGKAFNNTDGSKCDIIEGLDLIDRIRVVGVNSADITFASNITAKGVTGIGIYGKGALEAIYTGGNLSISQITQMTSGDDSSAALNNQIFSYSWTELPGVFRTQLA
jgi:Ca2+-binding RTX toxin-like protein